MDSIKANIALLTNQDHSLAYSALKELLKISEVSADASLYFEYFRSCLEVTIVYPDPRAAFDRRQLGLGERRKSSSGTARLFRSASRCQTDHPPSMHSGFAKDGGSSARFKTVYP